jgi:hypothetical protein
MSPSRQSDSETDVGADVNIDASSHADATVSESTQPQIYSYIAPSHSAPLAARGRLVGGSALVGMIISGTSVLVSMGIVGIATAADTAFLFGTLALGFGTLGWAASIAAGPGMAAMQAHLETTTNWDEMDSRRAMARIGGCGAGVMIAAIVIGMAFGYR